MKQQSLKQHGKGNCELHVAALHMFMSASQGLFTLQSEWHLIEEGTS